MTTGTRLLRTLGWSRPAVWLPALAGFALLGGIWQLVAVHNRFAIPTVPAIGSELARNPGFFWRNTLVTLQEVGVGVGVSFVVAFALAVVMCHVRVVERIVMPLAVVLNVTPVVSIAPGLVIVFGFSLVPRYVVTAIIVFFPFLVNALVGLRSVDPSALELMRTLHASRSEVLWRLRLPSSLPFLFAAARVCMPLSVVGAVVAEFSASGQSRGLGSVIEIASQLTDLPTIYAAIVVLAVVGLVLTLVVTLLERRLLSWHSSSSRGR